VLRTINGSSTAAIERRALEVAATFDRKIGPFRAEIVPDATPAWYIVRTAPGRETVAADHLEKRCVGIFLPRFVHGARMQLRSVDPTTGRQRVELIDLSDRLIFPAKVFVFVWDVLAHWRRITACPGVAGIMVDGNAKPIVLTDAQINRIQILQYELAIAPRKRRKRYRSAQDRLTLTTNSHWR
jgi:transcription antitermination factor NusG